MRDVGIPFFCFAEEEVPAEGFRDVGVDVLYKVTLRGSGQMEHIYPTYYDKFRCIAAACPDSCCQGWDVVIDEGTEEYYRSVEGEFGERLRNAIYTDADGDRVFRLAEQKKCPFWGEDKLCDIYRELGEEHLCATCDQFPRIRMEFEGFTEHTLALACPEAARLIVNEDDAYAGFTTESAVGCKDYGAEEMGLLLRTRKEASRILTEDRPLTERLDAFLRFAEKVQEEIGFYTEDADIPFPDLLLDLEYIDEKNRAMIEECRGFQPDLGVEEAALTRLALYWLYRYWATAIGSMDVLAAARMAAGSVRIVAAIAQKHGMTVAQAAQVYSKEIEQSYENMERILG